eukprot:4530245-Prymnesium_polylepis.1
MRGAARRRRLRSRGRCPPESSGRAATTAAASAGRRSRRPARGAAPRSRRSRHSARPPALICCSAVAERVERLGLSHSRLGGGAQAQRCRAGGRYPQRGRADGRQALRSQRRGGSDEEHFFFCSGARGLAFSKVKLAGALALYTPHLSTLACLE